MKVIESSGKVLEFLSAERVATVGWIWHRD